MTTINYLQAIRDAQFEEMARDDRVFIMGEDVAWNMLGSSEGFVEAFGSERVRNTPITEAAFTGAAAGAAMVGMRPIVDLMLTSFMYCAMDQIISIISKSTYLYGGQARLPLTIRASMFYGGSNAAQHSDRPLAPFMAHPRPQDHRAEQPVRRQGAAEGGHPRGRSGHQLRGRHAVDHHRRGARGGLHRPARAGGREARGLAGDRRGDIRRGPGRPGRRRPAGR